MDPADAPARVVASDGEVPDRNVFAAPDRAPTIQLTMGELEKLMDARAEKEREESKKERADLEARLKREMEATLRQERETIEELMDTMAKKEREELAAMVQAINRTEIPETSTLEVGTDIASLQEESESSQLISCKIPEEFKGEEGSQQEWHAPFGESVYTLLYMCEFHSQSFLYSMFIYGIQIATITLTLADVSDEPYPPMVDLTVTCAQAVTIFVVLAFMSDLIEATLKLQDGFYPEVTEEHPGATFSTWFISCLAQLFAGLLLLTASFLLTMQVETVIDAMLNMTALLFMAEIDDIGFAMAKMGFVTDELQSEAQAVINFRVPKRKTRNLYRRILYFLSLTGLFLGYWIIKSRQLNGYYLPTYIYVQFGDAYNPKIPYYSGIMTSGNLRTTRHREYRDMSTGNILLAYCHDKKAWTFSQENDACAFFAKSYQTETFDVTTIHDSQWEVLDSIQRSQPFDSFSLVSRDCDPSSCQGSCVDGLCGCPHDSFGMDCEFSNVCPKIFVDERFDLFPQAYLKDRNGRSEATAISNEFALLQNGVSKEYVRVYNMPVYYSNKTYPANIIFFGGRRWVLTTEWDLFSLTEEKKENPTKWFFKETTVATLENKFHADHQAMYTPIFISDPVDFETPDFKPTPIGLRWWTVLKDNHTQEQYAPDVQLDVILDCERGTCLGEGEGFCGNGWCDTERDKCACRDYRYGDRCELVHSCKEVGFGCSYGNGFCDETSGICECNLPHFGAICEQSHKCYEDGGKCQNGGVCNSTTGICECPNDIAITGIACEKRASCLVFGCANGGICGAHDACVCRPPFYGTLCDLVNTTEEAFICSTDEDCFNGTCNTDTGLCTCEDPSRYGSLCEHVYDCSARCGASLSCIPCLNSGTCNDTTGICDCPAPFTGPDCSQVPPCLEDTDCGGLPWNSCNVDTGNCLCGNGLVDGRRCEVPSTFCVADEECHYFGVCENGWCKCSSTGQSTGFRCESKLVDGTSAYIAEAQTRYEEKVKACGFDNLTCITGWR